MSQTIQTNSLVTLHYRITLDNGQPLISTFEGTPATLQLGNGELLPSLEALLTGLEPGAERAFDLKPEQAFGEWRSELMERVQRRHIPDAELEAMSIMEFTAPDGSRYSGLVREVDDQSALIDFNHPLAGKSIRFEVRIIGTM